MLFLQIVIFLFFALAVPVGIGAGAAAFVDRQRTNPGFMWMAGYLLFWAAFQILTVPFIIKGFLFSKLVLCFGILGVLMAAGGMALWFYRQKKAPAVRAVHAGMDRTCRVLWLVFGLILLLQLFLTAYLAFGDGDDAYFVAVSTTADTFDVMYRFSPYTGSSTQMDIRHCLAPFPIFVAFLSKVSGLHEAVVFHVALPLLLIPLTYCIYGMIGSRLFKGRKKQLVIFMLSVELLVMWGNYSLYTAETFLMTRTSQGKAILGNVVIPALFLLLYMVGERLAENRRVEKCLWVLLAALVTAACLCSLLGTFLVAVLLGAFLVCVVCSYRKWKLILPVAVCLLPAAIYLGMYMMIK